MKYTQIAADAFKKLQLNSGMLVTSFDPDTGVLDRSKIFAATGGGISFEATPNYIDFGEDIDNVPNNTKELKQLDYFDAKMSGTAKTADSDYARAVVAAADVSGNKVTPRSTLIQNDFFDVWWVSDYSDINIGDYAGFMAIKLINALSTGGFKVQSNDKGKGDFAFEFTGHYSLDDIDTVPFEIYIKEGGTDTTVYTEESLNALTVDQIKAVAEARGYTITKTVKAEIITEFLEQQNGE